MITGSFNYPERLKTTNATFIVRNETDFQFSQEIISYWLTHASCCLE